jgi:hypothetical protein
VEQVVLAKVLELAAAERDGTPEVLARRSRAARAGADAAALRAEEKVLLDSIGRTGALLGRGVLDEVSYAATMKELRAELRSVQGRLREAEARAGAGRPAGEALASMAEQAAVCWVEMTAVEQREFLCLFLRAVTLRPAAYRGQPIANRLDFEEMAT